MGAVFVLHPDQTVNEGKRDGREDGGELLRSRSDVESVEVFLDPVFQCAIHKFED